MMWSSVGYVGRYGMFEYDIYVSYHVIYDLDLLDGSISQLMPIHVHFSFFIHTNALSQRESPLIVPDPKKEAVYWNFFHIKGE